MAYTGCLILISLFGIGAYGSTSVMLRAPINIHNSDMCDEMQEEALQIALLAVNTYTKENDIARYIVKEFHRRHWGTWQCIVGNSGYVVTHRPGGYSCFTVGDKTITIFRSS